MVDLFGIIYPQIEFEDCMRRADERFAKAASNDDLLAGFGRQISAEDFKKIMMEKLP